MIIFFICISAVVIQRLVELGIAKNNSRKMFEKGAVEIDKTGYSFIVLMHIFFFGFLAAEFFLLNRSLNDFWYIFVSTFLAAQVIRYWAISTLGEYWNTRIIVLKGSPLIKSGPYKYLSHPNYIAVGIELAALPLIFSCYITFIIFSVLNFFVLLRRIKIETEALGSH